MFILFGRLSNHTFMVNRLSESSDVGQLLPASTTACIHYRKKQGNSLHKKVPAFHQAVPSYYHYTSYWPMYVFLLQDTIILLCKVYYHWQVINNFHSFDNMSLISSEDF